MLVELNKRRVAGEVEAFDMTTATKAEVEAALPSWHAERRRFTQDRIRQRDTTQGDKLFVTLLRGAGVSVGVGLAVLAAVFAFSTAGAIAALVAGAAGLAVGLAAVSGAVRLARGALASKELSRQAAVARLDLGIRQLDDRISRAFLMHALIPHTRTRISY